MDYELSDNDVYNAVAKAKGFIDKSTTALEIMNLVKFILDHEIDVNENVSYIVSGILVYAEELFLNIRKDE